MKSRRCAPLVTAAVVAVVNLFGAAHLSAQGAQPLRLATQELPPYQMIEGDRMTGIAVRRIRCALDRLDISYELYMTTWSEAQLGTQTGRFDGFFVGSSNAARAEFSVSSIPVVSESLAWYLPLNSEIDPNDAKDALRARYGAKFATSKWRYLHRNGYNVVMRPRDADSLLNMLLVGDVDVALEYELIFAHFLGERGLSESQFQKVPFRRQHMGAHFSKRFVEANPLFLKRFNESLQQCLVALQ
ncbi:transporter substrate-binding domain-containing protein [uncultured Sulfitobacter sp.]|uniref:substrate-binding periplasmic protein n=1 Tax=uncultured Sulfitobacter sp. TaxID=191468 RepID=UPI0030DBDC1A|tara:strand:+ start:27536 stop:28267 length:732 start_codon:yes stop_codon:yes gene_type:complete